MKPVLYWLEDEAHYFDGLKDEMEAGGFQVVFVSTAALALKQIETIAANPGVVILDLWLPRGSSPQLPKDMEGPELGLWLLGELERKLGKDWPILILSGNLSVDVLAQLRKAHQIPEARIYLKPLIEVERFLDSLHAMHDELKGRATSKRQQ